jgi:serine/threonine protein kinase
MHKLNIVHRDLKPQNVMIDSTLDKNKPDIKLVDFGFATYYDADKKLSLELGSPLYMAPEIINRSKYDSKVDVWSTGVLVYYLLSNDFPFIAKSKDGLYAAIRAG